jgi:transposase
VKRLRREFLARIASVEPERLVFVDESGATTAMTRLRGRAPRGVRVPGATPHGHWKVTTILGAIRRSGTMTVMTIDSPTDSDVFRAYVERVLVPSLRPGDVVVMDNLSAHKAPGIAERIDDAGGELIYLPPYSPDLNPIEPCWSKVKEFLRAAKARTQALLEHVIGKALDTVTAADARGWFRHCGYVVH